MIPIRSEQNQRNMPKQEKELSIAWQIVDDAERDEILVLVFRILMASAPDEAAIEKRDQTPSPH